MSEVPVRETEEDATPGGSGYQEVIYAQFSPSRPMRLAMVVVGFLSWPAVIPLALASRLSDIIFRTCSELLGLVPYFPGVIVRYEFYRFALAKCGRNIVIESGAVLLYRSITLGDNVLIGRQAIIHDCAIGSNVLIGERCTILSGSRQHHFNRRDVPIAFQGGSRRRLAIADDCWIGSHAVIMEDVGTGCVVAAGAVVAAPVLALTIVGGVPAKVIGVRP